MTQVNLFNRGVEFLILVPVIPLELLIFFKFEDIHNDTYIRFSALMYDYIAGANIGRVFV